MVSCCPQFAGGWGFRGGGTSAGRTGESQRTAFLPPPKSEPVVALQPSVPQVVLVGAPWDLCTPFAAGTAGSRRGKRKACSARLCKRIARGFQALQRQSFPRRDSRWGSTPQGPKEIWQVKTSVTGAGRGGKVLISLRSWRKSECGSCAAEAGEERKGEERDRVGGRGRGKGRKVGASLGGIPGIQRGCC